MRHPSRDARRLLDFIWRSEEKTRLGTARFRYGFKPLEGWAQVDCADQLDQRSANSL